MNPKPMTPPIIGITTYNYKPTGNFYSPAGYTQAVQSAGGIPILLPPVQSDPAVILKQVDGLIFTGGGDIDPDFYNGSPHPTIYGTDPERDQAELALAKLALAKQKPVLGICRGLEVLMVASGGDLVPHLPDEFGEDILHREEMLKPSQHTVRIYADSQLSGIMGEEELTVVSWHHQTVRTIPCGWQIVAKAEDGLIEALEHKQHPFAIALQWHPELSLPDSRHFAIFQALIQAASFDQDKLNPKSFHLQTTGWGCG
jgi:putative glutamine amidotransferase